MAMTSFTDYDEIYQRFLSKIHDYDLLKEIELDIDFARSTLLDFLKSAVTEFTYTDIEFDEEMNDELEAFNIPLTSMEKEIIARFMIVEYLSPRIIKSEIFEQRLGSKDFQIFSPGNLLGKLKELRQEEEDRANVLMLQYYFLDGV